jgi:hypothetical protein
MGQRLIALHSVVGALRRSLRLTEQLEFYLGVIVTLMFLAGCFLTVVSIRERSEEHSRWRVPTVTKPRLLAGSKT